MEGKRARCKLIIGMFYPLIVWGIVMRKLEAVFSEKFAVKWDIEKASDIGFDTEIEIFLQ